MGMSQGIRFHKMKEPDYCDICGLVGTVIESDLFDNGNASDTRVKFCRSCLRSLDMLFD